LARRPELRGSPALAASADGARPADLHYAVRVLRRNPGYALMGMVCLALGIGVNSKVFSMENELFWNPCFDVRVLMRKTSQTRPFNPARANL
jgi:hypothetical protein